MYSLCEGARERSRSDLSMDEKLKRAFFLTQKFVDQVRMVYKKKGVIFYSIRMVLRLSSVCDDEMCALLLMSCFAVSEGFLLHNSGSVDP